MAYYFRHISKTQARRYISLASCNLPLAINLVHHDRFISSSESPSELLPDGGNMKAALRFAAIQAEHPAPDVLAQLIMTAKYPQFLYGLITRMREAEALSTNDVYAIKEFLGCQWPSSAPPPVSIQFCCRPNGNNCRRLDDGKLLILTDIGNDLVAEVSIVPKHCYQPISLHKYIFDLTFDDNAEMKAKLSECLAVVMSCRGGNPRARDDNSPCEHLLALKLCLLDTIHAFYIKALAILPTCALSANLIRALLVAGHCYGPLDPVSNVILNSLWYDTAFPVAPGVQLPQDILDTVHMARMESRSLDGLVATLVSHDSTKHEALEQIFTSRCDLSGCPLPEFTDVAKAAKHPHTSG
ncbi:hypothetical protein QOZ80_1AG0009100 [Eleusine coracana subsp. coracana]|nr:hypothetical protein QOZ80_1AG0009100 [Eleusine coracana subsp. coracana]